jgi:hypothetical protein
VAAAAVSTAVPVETKQFESYLPVATVAYNFEDFLVSRPP